MIKRQDMTRFYDYDALIVRFIDQANAGQDIFEDIAGIGADITDLDTLQRFFLGDCARLVDTHYGEGRIKEFAKRAKRATQTIYAYRDVAAFYPTEARRVWLNEPVLSWSHLRDAMRLGTLTLANDMLERAASECWSVDLMSIEIKKILGQTVRPAPLVVPMQFYRDGARVYCIGMPDFEDGTTYDVTIRRRA